jgi:VIT1/CCC1 family predicted Fe2+/Mn2+ transporter
MARDLKPFSWPIGLGGARPKNQTEYNRFVLQTVQPGLAGLMDGSVSTLAPIFAVAFATRKPHIAFLVGLSAAIGAGISMAFAEALSDTGELTGRGRPFRRGVIIGAMTFLGGIFHTIPFLSSNFHTALSIAFVVVGIELTTIAYIRYRYFNMRFWLSVLQVVVGGALVFAAGIIIGSA